MAYDENKIPQRVGTESLGSVSFGNEGGKVSARWLVGSEYVNTFMKDVLGHVKPYANETQSGIQRNLPIATSEFPWLFCDGVTSVNGKNFVDTTDKETKTLGDFKRYDHQVLSVFAKYREYEVELNFSPRPYSIYSNEMILAQKRDIEFIRPGSDTPITFTDIMPEEYRFTTYQMIPKTEFLSAELNSAVYYDTTGGSEVNGKTSNASNTKILYPSSTVVIKWYSVPFSFVEGMYSEDAAISYRNVFEFGLGKVNYNSWQGYPAGTLLFEGINVTNINQVAFPDSYESTHIPDKFVFQNNLTCDIEMNFSYRNPVPGCLYENDGNLVFAGHNLVPRGVDGKNFAIVTAASWTGSAPDTSKTNVLLYQSFPFEILFANPLYVLPTLLS